jgi:hypothetical protein
VAITLTSIEDLRKLEGWVIDKVSYEPPGLRLTLSHYASPTYLVVILTPQTGIGLNNGFIQATTAMHIKAEEFPKEQL